jgi:hypothetical protein
MQRYALLSDNNNNNGQSCLCNLNGFTAKNTTSASGVGWRRVFVGFHFLHIKSQFGKSGVVFHVPLFKVGIQRINIGFVINENDP